MGIITKPDELPRGSDMERSFLSLAMNQRVYCGLGWHVLKNRAYDERNVSLEERDRLESEFLSSRIWTSLPVSQRGISSLRPRLSEILQKHIIAELPSLLAETQNLLLSTQDSLHRLGMPRQTLSSQRHYLLSLSDQFTQLINDAVNGTYIHSFFGDSLDDTHYTKRLRAVVQNRLQTFKDSLTQRGQARQILDDDAEITIDIPYVRRKDYLNEVKKRMQRSRGRELPGTFNPMIIGDLFRAQSKPWESITFQHFDILLRDVHSCVNLILEECIDEHSRDRLIKHVFTTAFDTLEDTFRSKTKELLIPHKQGHPITYNSYFIEKIEQARTAHSRRSMMAKMTKFFGANNVNSTSVVKTTMSQLTELIEVLAVSGEQDMDIRACSEAADHMQAYYEVAMAKFVDDFSDIAVEQCLMQPLLNLFRAKTVAILTDEVVQEIAKEDETSHNERLRLTTKAEMLQTALTRFHHLERYQSAALEAGRLAEIRGAPTLTVDTDTSLDTSESSGSQGDERVSFEPADPIAVVDVIESNGTNEHHGEPVYEEPAPEPETPPSNVERKKMKLKMAYRFE